MKYQVETIEFSLWPQLKTHLLINKSWTSNSDQFFVKREGCIYVLDAWFDKSDGRGWCGAFKFLNDPMYQLFPKESGYSFYDIKYKVISEALFNSTPVWKADYKDIVEEAINWANLS